MELRIGSRFLSSQMGFLIRRPCHIPSLGSFPTLDPRIHTWAEFVGGCPGECGTHCFYCIPLIRKKKARKREREEENTFLALRKWSLDQE